MAKLVLVRGLPGNGKFTKSKITAERIQKMRERWQP
jgi:tRNA uridine 5-carbamoylmethylation protein Kti12